MKSILPRSCTTLVLLACAALSLAGDPEPDKRSKALRDQLQGVWLPVDGLKMYDLHVEGDKLSLKRNEKGHVGHISGTYTLDAGARPSRLVLTIASTFQVAAEKYLGKSARAIVELDGDSLKWCMNEPGKADYPPQFAQRVGKNFYHFSVFKRMKK